jgi:hypothetical protein
LYHRSNVNRSQATLTIWEKSSVHVIIGNSGLIAILLPLCQSFVVSKEEKLVPLDRPTKGSPKLVAL